MSDAAMVIGTTEPLKIACTLTPPRLACTMEPRRRGISLIGPTETSDASDSPVIPEIVLATGRYRPRVTVELAVARIVLIDSRAIEATAIAVAAMGACAVVLRTAAVLAAAPTMIFAVRRVMEPTPTEMAKTAWAIECAIVAAEVPVADRVREKSLVLEILASAAPVAAETVWKKVNEATKFAALLAPTVTAWVTLRATEATPGLEADTILAVEGWGRVALPVEVAGAKKCATARVMAEADVAVAAILCPIEFVIDPLPVEDVASVFAIPRDNVAVPVEIAIASEKTWFRVKLRIADEAPAAEIAWAMERASEATDAPVATKVRAIDRGPTLADAPGAETAICFPTLRRTVALDVETMAAKRCATALPMLGVEVEAPEIACAMLRDSAAAEDAALVIG